MTAREPEDREAERAVLGSIFLHPPCLAEVLEVMRPDDVQVPAHRLVLDACVALEAKGDAIDILTVQSYLRLNGRLDAVGGPAKVMEFAEAVPTAANARHYAGIVRDAALRRELVSVAGRIVESTRDGSTAEEAIDRAEAEVFGVKRASKRGGPQHVKTAVTEAFEAAARAYETGNVVTGLASGFADYDRLTSGLQRGEVTVIGGSTSQGKTSLALSLVANVSLRGGKVSLIFSLEMPRMQLGARLIGLEARVDLLRFRSGMLSEREWQRVGEAASKASGAGIYIDDDMNVSLIDMRSRARRLASTVGLDLVLVDYLQLMEWPPEVTSEEQAFGMNSRGLKLLAMELNVPVVALSQLNRRVDERPTTQRRPVIGDLRGSGRIAQDADVVTFVYRDEVHNPDSEDKNIAELIVAKQRQGPLNTVRLRFDRTCTRFDNLDDDRVVRREPTTYAGRSADIREADEMPERLDGAGVLAEARR